MSGSVEISLQIDNGSLVRIEVVSQEVCLMDRRFNRFSFRTLARKVRGWSISRYGSCMRVAVRGY